MKAILKQSISAPVSRHQPFVLCLRPAAEYGFEVSRQKQWQAQKNETKRAVNSAGVCWGGEGAALYATGEWSKLHFVSVFLELELAVTIYISKLEQCPYFTVKFLLKMYKFKQLTQAFCHFKLAASLPYSIRSHFIVQLLSKSRDLRGSP